MSEPVSSADELAKLRVEVWKKTIETQMHFNEMSVKARQLGMTFVVAALGVAVVLLGRTERLIIEIPIFSYEVGTHVSGLIVLIAAAAVVAVRRLDLRVYHRMLRGAVTFGEQFEQRCLRPEIIATEKGLTESVSHYSRFDDATITTSGEYKGSNKTTAEDKLKAFYRLVIGVLFAISAILIYAFFTFKAPANKVADVSGGAAGGSIVERCVSEISRWIAQL